jgi:hypothetical protein
MTVGELINELRRHPQDMLVVRADIDWSGVQITQVEDVTLRCAHSNGTCEHFWEEYYPDLYDGEDGPLIKGIRIR